MSKTKAIIFMGFFVCQENRGNGIDYANERGLAADEGI